MKLRSNHVVAFVGVAIFGFVLFAAMRSKNGPGEHSLAITERPKMVIEQTSVDMGTISNSEVTEYKVKIRNEGRAPLRFLSAQGSCPCIAARLDRTSVLPGSVGNLIIEMDPYKDLYTFAFKKSVSLRTNDPSTDFVLIEVSGKIDPEFALEPAGFDFGVVQKGQTIEKTILLRQLQEEPLQVTGLDLGSKESDGVEFSFVERPREEWAQPDKSEYIITARLLPHAPTGRIAEYVRLITNCKRFPKGFPVIVSAEVEAFYSADPPRVVVLRQAAPGQTIPAAVTLTSASPIAVTDIECSVEGISAEARQGDTPDTVLIDVTVASSTKPGRVKGTLTFVVHGEGQSVPDRLTFLGQIQRQSAGGSGGS